MAGLMPFSAPGTSRTLGDTSAPAAATVSDSINAAIVAAARAARAAGATVIDMHAVANGPEGTTAIPAGWFSRDFGSTEMMRVGFVPRRADRPTDPSWTGGDTCARGSSRRSAHDPFSG